MRIALVTSIALWCMLGCVFPPAMADQVAMKTLVEHTGISKGIASVPNCGTGDLAIGLARIGGLLVHAFDADVSKANETRTRAIQAGIDGNGIVVERLPSDPLPYADSFVDLMIVDGSDYTCGPRGSSTTIRTCCTPMESCLSAGLRATAPCK